VPESVLDPLDREQRIGLPVMTLACTLELGGGAELLAGPQTRAS
jgi:hypothetical protein